MIFQLAVIGIIFIGIGFVAKFVLLYWNFKEIEELKKQYSDDPDYKLPRENYERKISEVTT